MSELITNIFYGRIRAINSSDGMFNLLTTLPDKTDVNIKTEQKNTDIKIGYIYKMKVVKNTNSERNVYYLVEHEQVSKMENIEEMNMAYRLFDTTCPYDLEELRTRINVYVESIDNEIIYNITKALLDENEKAFYIFPAAQRFHHNYVGGLAYHTLGMLDLADSFLANYSYLDKDYLYAGIILHDMGKVKEFSGVENTEYKVEGQLLGHLVIGGLEIDRKALELGYQDTEEAMLLKHMVISHHGQPIYGAARKPQTPEATLLWYIDTLDSKFRVLGEVMAKVEPGTFSDQVAVMDKVKFYKKK